MPIMIPDPIPDHAPVEEKIIFETLKVASQGRDWAVLHSVSIGSRRFNFVILNPYNGSVICFEVVADKTYKFENERWSSPSGESPLKQAEEAMEDLKKHFAPSHFCSSSLLSLRCAIAFTDGTEIEEWLLPEHLKPMFKDDKLPGLALMTGNGQVFEDALHPHSLGLALWNCATDLDEKISYEESQEAQVALDKLRTDLVSTGETIRTIATIFHDNLETHSPRLLRLTEDQLRCLNLIGCQPPSITSPKLKVQEEDRCVIDGAAGTGKTVLAIELARQRCEDGESVALLCSNPNLSRRFVRWAGTLSNDKGGRVVAGTPTTLPLEVFREDSTLLNKHRQRLKKWPQLEESLKLGYLDDEWYPFIDETVEDLEQKGIFDYLIVDEAQNLCDKRFLKLMDALLKGKLANGRWTMLGDFTYQNIVSPHLTEGGKEVLRNYGLNWSDDQLKINCRNTHEIADTVVKFTGLPSHPMSGVHGPLVEIKYFESQEKLGDQLDYLIDDLKKRDFLSQQIILLTNEGDRVNLARSYGGWKLLNIREAKEVPVPKDKEGVLVPDNPYSNNTLRYSDIYDFQGLESEAVILVLPVVTTIVGGRPILPNYEHRQRMLYTGMSRAKTMLIIVAQEPYRNSLEPPGL